jgi:hypothetical protein
MVEFLNRYISIQKEGSTYGSTGAGGDEVYGEVDDETFQHNYDLLTRQDMSRQIASKSVTGTEYSEGGLNMALQVDDFVGNVLAAFFPVTAYGSDTHTFDEPSTSSHSYNTYTIQVGREQKEHSYTGMVGSRLSMTANVGEYVMLSADFIGQAEAGTGALQTATYDGDATDALYFANGTVLFDDGSGSAPAASASVKAFSFEVNLNRDTDNAYALGTRTYNRAPPSQRREITGTIEFNTVLYGDQTLDEPDYDALIAADGLSYSDAATDPTITLYLQDETADGSTFVKVHFYHVRFEAPTASVSGRDTNTMSVGFVGLYDATASGADKAMKIEMKGGAAGTDTY